MPLSLAKRAAEFVVGLVPAKDHILAWGARLPPSLKGPASQRVLGVISRGRSPEQTFETNLGMDADFHLNFPIKAGSLLLFGNPRSYRGERGGLYLSTALVSDCEAMLDVGANHGYYTFFVAANARSLPIYFFEPHPQLFEELSRNIARHPWMKVVGNQMAMGKENGRARFLIDLSNDLSSSLTEDFTRAHQTQATEVAITTYSHFVSQRGLKNLLVKVDVEGAELDFLAGALASKDTIRYLIIEVLESAVRAQFIPKAKEQLGMEAYYMDDFSLHHSKDGAFAYKTGEYNWLFCRLKPRELSKRLTGTEFTVHE